MAKKTAAGNSGASGGVVARRRNDAQVGHLVGKLEPLHSVLESAAKRALGAEAKHTADQLTQGERAARKAHERSRR